MGARMVPANGQTTKTKKKIMSFYLECICRYIALVDCICMEDV